MRVTSMQSRSRHTASWLIWYPDCFPVTFFHRGRAAILCPVSGPLPLRFLFQIFREFQPSCVLSRLCLVFTSLVLFREICFFYFSFRFYHLLYYVRLLFDAIGFCVSTCCIARLLYRTFGFLFSQLCSCCPGLVLVHGTPFSCTILISSLHDDLCLRPMYV